MPSTRRQSAQLGEELLHGLTQKKRIRKASGMINASNDGIKKVTKKNLDAKSSKANTLTTSKKGKKKVKKQDPNLSHVKLANMLLNPDKNPTYPERTPQQGNLKPAQQNWESNKDVITNPADLPEGWTADEADLDPNDIGAQIARCEQRIEEGIMPEVFEIRLQQYQEMRDEEKEMYEAEPNGLSWEVIQRLDALKQVRDSLEEEQEEGLCAGNEEDEEIEQKLSNVRAIITAYRAKALEWDEDNVSYWANGKLVAGPKVLDMPEVYTLSDKYGSAGFWVEGVDGTKPGTMNVFFTLPPTYPGLAMQRIDITLRNPAVGAQKSAQTSMTFDFLLDSGASALRMFETDRQQLEQLSGAPVPTLSTQFYSTASGKLRTENICLQAMIHRQGQPIFPTWVDIKCALSAGGPSPGRDRLSGVWLYHLLFVMSMPDNTHSTHIGTDIYEMLNTLPVPDIRNAVGLSLQ
ncbi:hypothetical protein N7457_006840 [Penicillium paradoxum]|uniref:uncharacterized protein n=1 Tax=Penicillium paradoxum TaxID=176176 RepID=UPI0025476164|nr:uncharacterized protein N7457_006840 [Penicillium paradoxum]KAJ5779120.1 hypothetical protein N7457_006840 [Penicillium paradoxum]